MKIVLNVIAVCFIAAAFGFAGGSRPQTVERAGAKTLGQEIGFPYFNSRGESIPADCRLGGKNPFNYDCKAIMAR